MSYDYNHITLGFKNFRKFAECPPIEINGVTYLVGKNNSGKSTYIKGMLLLGDNYKNIFESCEDICHPKFSFKGIDARIATFDKALFRDAKDSNMIFSFAHVEIGISGKRGKNEEEVPITYIKLGNDWFFDFVNQNVTYTVDLDWLKKTTKDIEIVKAVNQYVQKRNNTKAVITVPFIRAHHTKGNIDTLKESIWKCANGENGTDNVLSQIEKDFVIALRIGEYNSLAAEEDLLNMQQKSLGIMGRVSYIPAHDVPKNNFFNAEDTNDFTTKTIYEFSSTSIETNKEHLELIHYFLKFWMQEFEIGTDFKIKAFEDNIFSFQICNKNGAWIHLSEMGRGSVQLMLMLIRVATFMLRGGFFRSSNATLKDTEVFDLNDFGDTSNLDELIIIEEPEQNLHPALQSKLADFFCSLCYDHGYHCLIETHSEYIIRKLQVIVSKGEYIGVDIYNNSSQSYNEHSGDITYSKGTCEGSKTHELKVNPFHIYYFPHDEWLYDGEKSELPYEMIFREDGFFENSFGPGFLDEASKWHLELLRHSNN